MKRDERTGEDCSKRSKVSAEQHSSTGLTTSYRTSSPRQVMAAAVMRGMGETERKDIPSAWADRTGSSEHWAGGGEELLTTLAVRHEGGDPTQSGIRV